MTRDKSEPDVHATFFQCGFNFGGRNFFHDKADAGMILGKQSHQMRHERHIEDRNDADMKNATPFSWFTAQFLKTIFQLTQEQAGVLLKDQSVRGQQDPLPAALEKRNAKASLEIAHLL